MTATEIRKYVEDCASDASSNDGLIVARAVYEVAAQLAEIKAILAGVLSDGDGSINVDLYAHPHNAEIRTRPVQP